MKKIVIYGLLLFNLYSMKGQDLFAISPLSYPKTESQIQENGNFLFTKFGIEISRDKEIFYKNKLIYKCDFTEYYEYLIEVFSAQKEYLIVSPLRKVKGVATPYNIDRGIVLIFDYHNKQRFYANLNIIKKIQLPSAFEFTKDKPHAFMIKNIDVDKKELILLQGGNEIKEVIIELYEF